MTALQNSPARGFLQMELSLSMGALEGSPPVSGLGRKKPNPQIESIVLNCIQLYVEVTIFA